MNSLRWDYEDSFPGIVCGTDEAGRGPLAGRVYAAAVILPREDSEELAALLDDSKKLTPKKRDTLAVRIKSEAVSWCVAYSEVEEIERLNILEASLLAMRRAVLGLDVKPEYVLVDGCIDRGFDKIGVKAKCIVGGDGISPSVAAASILAKTERDRYCLEVLHAKYPEYGFDKHKGYGTALHYKAVDEYGLCPEHRPSFFKKYFEKKKSEKKAGGEHD